MLFWSFMWPETCVITCVKIKICWFHARPKSNNNIEAKYFVRWVFSENTRRCPNVVLMMGQRLRRWPIINTALGQRLKLLGNYSSGGEQLRGQGALGRNPLTSLSRQPRAEHPPSPLINLIWPCPGRHFQWLEKTRGASLDMLLQMLFN